MAPVVKTSSTRTTLSGRPLLAGPTAALKAAERSLPDMDVAVQIRDPFTVVQGFLRLPSRSKEEIIVSVLPSGSPCDARVTRQDRTLVFAPRYSAQGPARAATPRNVPDKRQTGGSKSAMPDHAFPETCSSEWSRATGHDTGAARSARRKQIPGCDRTCTLPFRRSEVCCTGRNGRLQTGGRAADTPRRPAVGTVAASAGLYRRRHSDRVRPCLP